MITTDPTRAVPTEWTTAQCLEIVAHASELAQQGNPAGALLLRHLDALGTQGNAPNPYTRRGARRIGAYLATHPDEAAHVWRLRVRSWS